MVQNKWKEIWEMRKDRFDEINMSNPEDVFLELKRIDGFDVVVGGVDYRAFVDQNLDMLRHLAKYEDIRSIFDVGCGCGANLLLCKNEGMVIGGIDYSSAQVSIARKIFKEGVKELICGEAIATPVSITYDAVISNSVFSYFPDEEYSEKVLDRMLEKSLKSIGLIDIHDIDKQEKFTKYRRETVENYDELYKDLPKLFYHRDSF